MLELLGDGDSPPLRLWTGPHVIHGIEVSMSSPTTFFLVRPLHSFHNYIRLGIFSLTASSHTYWFRFIFCLNTSWPFTVSDTPLKYLTLLLSGQMEWTGLHYAGNGQWRRETDNSPGTIPPRTFPLPCSVRVRVRSWVIRVRVGQ